MKYTKCSLCRFWFVANVLAGVSLHLLGAHWYFCFNYYIAALYPLGLAHLLFGHEQGEKA